MKTSINVATWVITIMMKNASISCPSMILGGSLFGWMIAAIVAAQISRYRSRRIIRYMSR